MGFVSDLAIWGYLSHNYLRKIRFFERKKIIILVNCADLSPINLFVESFRSDVHKADFGTPSDKLDNGCNLAIYVCFTNLEPTSCGEQFFLPDRILKIYSIFYSGYHCSKSPIRVFSV